MKRTLLTAAVILMIVVRPAAATKIGDITRLDGERTNVLTGMGLVVGLKGTGDGGAYLPAMKPLAQMLSRFGDPIPVDALGAASNVAIVSITATIQSKGVRSGDHLDVRVSSTGAATSLAGGVLYNIPLLGPTGKLYARDAQGNAGEAIPYALVNGPIKIEDPTIPTNGVVKGGAVSEVNLIPKVVDSAGRFTLILNDPSASWETANMIATLINQGGENTERTATDSYIAVAVDAKNVVVQIPAAERARPDAFIAGVLKLPLRSVTTDARVRINDKTGSMMVTGDVEIGPTVIIKRGLTITTVTPPPTASPRSPLVSTKSAIALDTTNEGGAKLQDLAAAFDQLKVPAEDRIDIIKELYDTGKLHAKLVIDGEDQ